MTLKPLRLTARTVCHVVGCEEPAERSLYAIAPFPPKPYALCVVKVEVPMCLPHFEKESMNIHILEEKTNMTTLSAEENEQLLPCGTRAWFNNLCHVARHERRWGGSKRGNPKEGFNGWWVWTMACGAVMHATAEPTKDAGTPTCLKCIGENGPDEMEEVERVMELCPNKTYHNISNYPEDGCPICGWGSK